MSKEKLYKYLIISLILIGGIFRLSVYYVSPPNNAYDDHLEVVNIYAQDFNRPDPFQCWECYQPPLYYYVSATVLRMSMHMGMESLQAWKVVQVINPLLSILILVLAYHSLRLLKIHMKFIALIISFLVVLPRDILTSAMIGNDYLLVFFSISAFYLFIKTLNSLKSGTHFFSWFCLLVITSLLASITKQHGLLLHLFPGMIIIMLVKKRNKKLIRWGVAILILGAILSLSEEYWKYNKTGVLLVSNQDYFDFAKNQFPGSLERVEFHTFKILELYKDPFISDNTSASIFTELFARTFFDYEWRFISPNIPWASFIGRMGLTLGLIWIFYFSVLTISWIKTKWKTKANLYNLFAFIAPLAVALMFFAVPVIQTFRYPYFSSMKSMYMLSGIIILLLMMGSLTKVKSLAQRFWPHIIALNIIYGIFMVVSVCLYIEISLNHLHGPLWQIP